ncbi:unnamed protein product [Miscanthus lutarioriparius]|uniref:Endonuclease/exonuclease/phosphatase domain-containing protein n=1 Tax=Miscanthus lutarioriparius TaxID=422564 RepID=A0A811MNV0_9POAL|nr:unnamed protein product [Miscanthus lutarioriparius]
MRKIAALYEKFKATGSGSDSGRGRGRGRGKGKEKVKGARSPSPVASSSSSEEEEVPSAHTSGDEEEVQEEQEQVEAETVGSQEDADKILFLEELEAIRDTCQGPWAITGDFNLILNEADKSNERIDRTNLRRFRRTVAALELQDLHLHGRCFTWSNEREHPTLVRLDRVLVSIDWDTLFPNAHLRGLSSDASDHAALLLQTNLGQMSKVRFHFELFWPKFDDYIDVVLEAWKRPANIQDPMLRLDAMLRSLVRDLQRRAAERISEIKAQLLMARELVLRLDSAQERRQLSEAVRRRTGLGNV